MPSKKYQKFKICQGESGSIDSKLNILPALWIPAVRKFMYAAILREKQSNDLQSNPNSRRQKPRRAGTFRDDVFRMFWYDLLTSVYRSSQPRCMEGSIALLNKLIASAVLIMTVMSPQIGASEENIVPSHIHNSVYEVIVPKPSEGSLIYEKPLPLDLLPFLIRNDKYYSIGTAFAISGTEFVTAAHVLSLGVKSQFKEIFVRDINGRVFPLDQMIKFSSRRDFAVFTVKERASAEHLDLNPEAKINEKVYAVGNALGEG
ncbi:MAG: serine protease, partial [Candidatus Manganitrophaceae bacterium]